MTTYGLSISVWNLNTCSRIIHIHNHNNFSYPSYLNTNTAPSAVTNLTQQQQTGYKKGFTPSPSSATLPAVLGGSAAGGMMSGINGNTSSASGSTAHTLLRQQDMRTPPLPVMTLGSSSATTTPPGLSGLNAASVAAALAARTESLRSGSVSPSPSLMDPAGVMKPPALEDARITTLTWINEAYDSLLLVCTCLDQDQDQDNSL